MIEFLLELFLDFLGFFGLKKKKEEETKSASPKTNDLIPEQDTHEKISPQGVPVCAGCNRVLEKDVIYELGKSWCTKCYKTHVLKIKE